MAQDLSSPVQAHSSGRSIRSQHWAGEAGGPKETPGALER